MCTVLRPSSVHLADSVHGAASILRTLDRQCARYCVHPPYTLPTACTVTSARCTEGMCSIVHIVGQVLRGWALNRIHCQPGLQRVGVVQYTVLARCTESGRNTVHIVSQLYREWAQYSTHCRPGVQRVSAVQYTLSARYTEGECSTIHTVGQVYRG